MRTFKRLLGFILIFALVTGLLTLCLTPPSGIRVLLKEAEEPQYDTLIMGQSHGECGYDPYIISDELGVEATNVSRRLTPINNMYYILREANKEGNYKTVILDIDPYYWLYGQYRDYGTDMNLLPYLSGSNRWDYFKNEIADDAFTRLFCDYYISLENIRLIPETLKVKFSEAYLKNDDSAMNGIDAYLKSDNAYAYLGRGFLYGANRAPDLGWTVWLFDEGKVDEENIESLRQICEYCEENDIRLVCVQSALTPNRLHQQNMDDVHAYYTALCDSLGIEFYDFNYAKKEYLDRMDEDYVDMDGHPMGDLADRQTELLCRVMETGDVDTYFYSDYEEVLANY